MISGTRSVEGVETLRPARSVELVETTSFDRLNQHTLNQHTFNHRGVQR